MEKYNKDRNLSLFQLISIAMFLWWQWQKWAESVAEDMPQFI